MTGQRIDLRTDQPGWGGVFCLRAGRRRKKKTKDEKKEMKRRRRRETRKIKKEKKDSVARAIAQPPVNQQREKENTAAKRNGKAKTDEELPCRIVLRPWGLYTYELLWMLLSCI